MDVTNEILQAHLVYGGSDNTAPASLSSSKSLNYAAGASINNPAVERITKIPYAFNFKDTVGLFGAENTFIRIDLDIIDTGTDRIIINTYEAAEMTQDGGLEVNYYESGYFNASQDNSTVNEYEPALVEFTGLPDVFKPKISINLENLKTGNQYIDSWFDVRLYTKNKEEHGFDKLYLNLKDSFYIGFHARNTRRLPYNVRCSVGDEYVGIDQVDKHYLPVS